MENNNNNNWKKEALVQFKKELEDEILSQFDMEDEEIKNEIRQRIKEKVFNELQEEFRLRIQAVKKELREEAISKIEEKAKIEEEEEYILRFGWKFRIQHMILFVSVFILIITGLPLKFPDFDLLSGLINFLGGIENSRIIHRIGAGGLIGFIIIHTIYTVLAKEGRQDWWLLLPRPSDIKNLIQMIKFFLGKAIEKPKFDRFSYIEKFDYWAVYWGCLIMIGTGLVLWFENITLKFLPKFFMDISMEAHSDEALLATLAIVIWHFYNVHFNPEKFPGSWMWLTGKISKKEILEEHPLEYERIMKEKKRKEEEKLEISQYESIN